jgi:hypothetical protein
MGEVTSSSGGFVQFTPSHEVKSAPGSEGTRQVTLTTISKSELERETELASLLPKPWLDQAMFTMLWLNMDQNLGLGAIGADIRDKSFGLLESSIILSMADAFMKRQNMSQNLQDNQKNLLETLLTLYSKQGANAVGDGLQTLQLVRNSQVLLSGIKSVSPSSLLSALKLAELQIATQVLQSWSEAEQKLYERMREEEEYEAKTKPSPSQVMLQDYIHNIQSGKEALSQPVLSFMVTGIISGQSVEVPLQIDANGNVSFDASKDSLGPVGQTVIFDLVQSVGEELGPQFKNALVNAALDCATLASNVMQSCAYWSIPGAVTFATAMRAEVDPGADLPAVQSYALTMAAFTGKANFAEMIQNRVLKYIDLEAITQERLDVFISATKITLLANALAALDKTVTGGVVIRGIDIEQLITNQVKMDDDDRRL